MSRHAGDSACAQVELPPTALPLQQSGAEGGDADADSRPAKRARSALAGKKKGGLAEPSSSSNSSSLGLESDYGSASEGEGEVMLFDPNAETAWAVSQKLMAGARVPRIHACVLSCGEYVAMLACLPSHVSPRVVYIKRCTHAVREARAAVLPGLSAARPPAACSCAPGGAGGAERQRSGR